MLFPERLDRNSLIEQEDSLLSQVQEICFCSKRTNKDLKYFYLIKHNHNILLQKLQSASVPVYIVRLICFYYYKQ